MTVTLASQPMSVKRSPISTPTSQVSAQTTLVIIDSGVEDYAVLAAGVLPNAKAILLDANEDGIAQITAALQAHPHTTHLHIVAHGSPGCLYLGNTQLSLETLDRYSWELQSWFDSTAPSLCLYACNVASEEVGTEFLTRLHQLTGATLHASRQMVGNASLNGSWELDVTIPKTASPASSLLPISKSILQTYPHTLSLVWDTANTLPNNSPNISGQYGLEINGSFLYATDYAGGNIDIYRIDAATGGLTYISSFGSPGSGTNQFFYPIDLDFFTTSGGLTKAYVPDGNRRIVALNVDTTTGVLSWDAANTLPNGSPNISTQYGLEINGSFLYATDYAGSNIDIYRIDAATGGLTYISSFGSQGSGTNQFANPIDLDFFSTAGGQTKAYVPDYTNRRIVALDVNTTTGILSWDAANTLPNGSPNISGQYGLEIKDNFLYATDSGGGNIDIYRIDAATGGLTYVSSFGSQGSGTNQFSFPIDLDFFTISGGQTKAYVPDNGNRRIVVLDVNTTPSFSDNAALADISEDPITIAGDAIANLFAGKFVDPDPGSSLSGVAVVGNTANATTEGTWQYSTDNGANWFDVGVVAEGATALALSSSSLVRFAPVANYNGTPPALTVRAIDNLYTSGFTVGATRQTVNTTGNGAIATTTNTISTSITPVNDAPSFTANATLAATPEDSTNPSGSPITTLFSGAFQDVDAGSSLAGVAIVGNTADAVTEGKWQFSTDSGASWHDVGGVADGATALALPATSSVRFVPVTNYNGTPGGLTVRALDNTYSGGFTSGATRQMVDTSINGGTTAVSGSTNTISTSVTATNDAPVLFSSSTTLYADVDAWVNGGSLTTNYGSDTSLRVDPRNSGRVSFLRFDLTPLATDAFVESATFKMTAYSGFAWGGDGNQYTRFVANDSWDENTINWNNQPTQGATLGYWWLWYNSTPGIQQGAIDITNQLRTEVAGDRHLSLGISSPGYQVNYYSSEAAVIPDYLPQLIINYNALRTLTAIDEDDFNSSGNLVSELTSGISDADAGALTGVAITAADSSNGTWQYSLDGGTTWNALGTVSNSSALLLASDSDNRIRFVPNADYNGTATFNFRAWDQTTGTEGTKTDTTTNGGSTAFSSNTGGASITINPISDTAVISGTSTGSVTEDGTLTATGTLTIVDPDAGEANFVAQTNTPGTYGSFSINTAGTWNYAADNSSLQSLPEGASVTDTFTVNSADGTPQTITITVNGVNDPAVIGGTVTGSVTEDGNLEASGALTVNDVDAGETGFVSNTEVSGTYGFFNFYDDGTWNYTADNESLQSLGEGQSDTDVFTIQTLDGTTQNITITVNGVNDAPELTGPPATLATAVEDTDYTLYATDLLAGFTDVDGDTPTVSELTATNGTLVDNLDGTWTFTPNAQFNGVVNLSYNVVDGMGGSTPATQSFNVTAVNDAPSLTANVTLPSVPEDSNPTGQVIASLIGPLFSDADLGDSLRGIAVVSNTANATTEGKWQYSTDGATWVDIGSVTDGATALALAATTQLRFLPVANYNGTPPALTIRALDNTYNGSFETTVDTTTRGGSTAIAGTSNTISTTILPVADITDVSATTPDGFYNAGDTIAITVTFDEIVNVTGTPQLTLNTGGTNAIATYDSGSGSNQLTFLYTVAAGDTSADLDYLSVTALSSNGGSIRNASNLDANLNLPTPGATSSLGANKNLIIDTTPPAVPVIVSFSDDSGVPKDNITNDTVLTLNGTAEANSTVTLLIDGADVTPFKVDDTGNWTFTTEILSEGSHTFSAIATDAAGNSSVASPDLSVLVDITPPFAPDLPDLVTASDTGRSNLDNITNDTTPTFSGIAEADSTISIFSGISLLGNAIADATGNWTFTAEALPAGNYSITTQITDAAGNTSDPSPTLDLVIDTVAPAAPSSPDLTAASDRGVSSTDNLTSETKPTFTGTAEANAIVELFSNAQSLGVTTADSTGRWSFTTTTALTAGSHNITAQATDVSGNTGPLSNPLALTIQTLVPTTNIIKITPDVRDSSVGTISLQFSQVITNFDLTDLSLTRDGAAISLTGAILTTQDNRTWTLTLPDALTNLDGRYKLSITTSNITSLSGAALSAGASEIWLVGHTATALNAIKFRAGKRGLRMQGTQNAEKFRGTFYDDVLKGMSGDDTLIAGYGKAQFGVDRLYGGAGDDTLISGRGNDLLYGEADDDLLLGGDRHDRLDGGSGNDRLLGGEGNDVLVGGAGDDTLTGGKGRDTFVYKTLNDGKDVITDFNSSQDLIDLRSIMRQPAFGGDNPFARFMQYVQMQQVGANTEVQIDADGSGAGQTFTTLTTLKNTTLNSITSRNFIVV